MTTKHREGELEAWEELAQETDENGEQYEKYHYSDGTSAKCWLGLND